MVPAEQPTRLDGEYAAKLLNRTMPLRSPAPTCPKRTGRRTKKSTARIGDQAPLHVRCLLERLGSKLRQFVGIFGKSVIACLTR